MNTDKNMNDLFNDIDFEKAYNLCQSEFSHSDLINLLQNGSIQEKQIAALKFDYVDDINDAMALLNNLTGCDGKIREAVAYKINIILSENKSACDIFANIVAEQFAKATIDINANICRLIIDSANILKHYKEFAAQYTDIILCYTNEALTELDKFIFRDKKYVINKQLFKLYWCLEALDIFFDYVDTNIMEEILIKCASQSEYTIREKVAKIVIKSNKFNAIKQNLESDTNYYVKQILNH